MLCEACRFIFRGGPQTRGYRLETIGVEHGRTTRYIHHATTQGLVESASLFCYICTRVWSDALSHGFARGPGLRWQSSCSTSYVIQTLDRHTLSISSLELLVSYVRKRRVIDDGPGAEEVIFWTKFVLEPAEAGTRGEVSFSASGDDLATNSVVGEGQGNRQNGQNTIESTGSDRAWKIASRWISNCMSDHIECVQPGHLGQQLPTRLLKVGNVGSPIIQLYENSDLLCESKDMLNPFNETYMTLSHCWGSAQILTLNKSTYEKLKSGINVSELPQTFQDAIQFIRQYKVKYIWIDSLCIFQDSIDDWLRESAAMTRIYRQSICNISALASSSSNGGCFRKRDLRVIQPCRVDADWDGLPKGSFNIYHEMFWQDDVAAAPLHKRAWVVQERLLAPRILHFGQKQLFWECHTMNACETYPNGLPPCLTLLDQSIGFKGLDPSTNGENLRKMANLDCSDSSLNQLYVWEKVVRMYTSCALTKGEDKLVAISGIAKRVQPLTLNSDAKDGRKLASYHPSQYLAGLWDFFLPAQLLWDIKSGVRPKIYRAPSWSWASIDGCVSFQNAFNDGTDHIKIIKSTTNPVSEDPFGQVSGGCIQLEGHLKRLEMTVVNRFSNDECFVMTINGKPLSTLCRPDVSGEPLPEILYCLPVRTYRMTSGIVTSQRLGCLILTPTGAAREEYHRWAHVSFDIDLDQRAIHQERRLTVHEYVNYRPIAEKQVISLV